ncbi:MAG: 30S ribosomal protein S19e [Candidatus Bathyarchaeota archaeon]|nr:30S ribosomal protein S19e [Candidatus Bathyarchaeota archaeon]
MPTIYEVQSDIMIHKLAEYLKENVEEIHPPSWSVFSKTGPNKENPPQNPDWWYLRCASILRKIYFYGPLGVSRLRVKYGGKERKGTRRRHTKKGGGSSVRKPLQQLEEAGLISKDQSKGRQLSNQGRSLLDKMATQIISESNIKK